MSKPVMAQRDKQSSTQYALCVWGNRKNPTEPWQLLAVIAGITPLCASRSWHSNVDHRQGLLDLQRTKGFHVPRVPSPIFGPRFAQG